MAFSGLFSKIVAGGLSAGVFLLWWPEHVPGDGLGQLVLRGLLWTLSFELLLQAFAPLERMAAAVVRRRTGARRERVRARLQDAPAPARAGGAVALACLGVAAPVLLLADAPQRLLQPAPSAPKVIKQVIVKRQVVERQVVAPAPAAPSVTGLPERVASAPAPAGARTSARMRTAATTPARPRAPVPERSAASGTLPTGEVAPEPAAAPPPPAEPASAPVAQP